MFTLCNPNMTGLLQGEHPKIWAQSDRLPCWFERRRHSIANFGRMVTDSATVTIVSPYETTIALSNGAIADPLRPLLPPKRGFHMPTTYANGHISATGDPIHFMFGPRWGFRGRRIERCYLRFEQIQDGGHRHVGKISNGHISATGRPIHLMFCSRVGFSGTADLMALFSIRANSRWRPPPPWKISNGHISTTAHDLLIYSAHRAVIFAIAQLSCITHFGY